MGIRTAAVVVLIVTLGGCSSVLGTEPAASASSPEAWCLRNGGWWRPELNYCEYEPRIPFR